MSNCRVELSIKFFDAWCANYDANFTKECKLAKLDISAMTWQERDYLDLCLDETSSSLLELFETGTESLESLITRGISCAIESYRLEYK